MNPIDMDWGNDTLYQMELKVTLLLESDGKKRKVSSGNIERFELDFQPYGFDGFVHFSGFEDKELEEVFHSEKPINVTFSYQTKSFVDEKKDSVEVKGIVYKRYSKGIEKEAKEIRVYEVRFCDSARATWSHHYTKGIYIDKTMKDVIEGEKNPLIDLKCEWDVLTKDHPILAFSLEDDGHTPPDEKVSFYSFLHWYLEQEGGVLEYNYKDDKYQILGKKSAEGEPLNVAEFWITSPRCIHPEPLRSADKEMKYFPDKKMEGDAKENDKGFESVRCDKYEDTTYNQFPEQMIQKVASPPIREKIEATFWVEKFDEKFQFDQLFPGTLITFKGRKKVDGHWCDHASYKGKVFRIGRTSIKGMKLESSQEVEIETRPYDVIIEVSVEEKDEKYIPRPTYRVPQYPFYILGTIFSKEGEEEQTTFNVITKDEKYPTGKYQVKVPLSGEEEKYVVVPFSSDYMTGQHYFPFCKDQQVMLRMDFQTAKVHRLVNWQPMARLPEGTQGCQVMWASNGEDKYVYQRHEFENNKESVLTIKQSSSKDQTQVITIKEKDLSITVEEKGKRTTQIQLNRDSGLLVQVQDDGAKITNSTLYDDKGMTHTSKGSGGTSTIVQKPDALEMTADTVSITCENLNMDVKAAATVKAGSKVLLDAPLTKATAKLSGG